MMVFLKKLHKWLGLLIGIQVLLWLLSGLMLSVISPSRVSGNERRRAVTPTTEAIGAVTSFEPVELPGDQMDAALSVSLEVIRGLPVYRVRYPGHTRLIDASSGATSKTSEQEALLLAQQDFTGDGEVTSISSSLAPDIETRNSEGEYWRVNFSDKAHTSIYISVSTGEILARRNSYWRVFDFFWMLHIMDYNTHEDINNNAVVTAALIAIWFGLSGFILLFGGFNRHDFYFLNVLGQRNDAELTLIDPDGNTLKRLRLRKGANLFLSLANKQIDVPSICGGGGECGKCRVKFEADDAPEANTIELGLIPDRLRHQGYRLACQQEVGSDATLYLPGASIGSLDKSGGSAYEQT